SAAASLPDRLEPAGGRDAHHAADLRRRGFDVGFHADRGARLDRRLRPVRRDRRPRSPQQTQFRGLSLRSSRQRAAATRLAHEGAELAPACERGGRGYCRVTLPLLARCRTARPRGALQFFGRAEDLEPAPRPPPLGFPIRFFPPALPFFSLSF